MFPRKFDSPHKRHRICPYKAIITKFEIHYEMLSRWVFGAIGQIGDV